MITPTLSRPSVLPRFRALNPPLSLSVLALLTGASLWTSAVQAQPAPPAPPAPMAPALPGGGPEAEQRLLRPGRPAPPVRPVPPALRPSAPPPAALVPVPPPRPLPPPVPRWRPAPSWPVVTVVPSWRVWPYYDPYAYPFVPDRYSPYYPWPAYGAAPVYGTTIIVPPSPWGTAPPLQWVERPAQSDASAEAGSGGSPLPGYWYWCADPAGWFPQVQECAGGFEPVAPQSEGSRP